MYTSFRKAIAILGLLVTGAVLAAPAGAQCPFDPQALLQQQSWHGTAQVGLMRVDFRREDMDDIVGFWNTTLSLKGSGGAPDQIIDKGLQQWHADGTEFLNSSGQHPLTQNYCLGVWRKTGPSKYTLNHFAYLYDTAQNVIGLANIREEVIVNHDGTAFTGVFAIQQYDALRNKLGGLLKGIVKGKRIDIDTSAQDIL